MECFFLSISIKLNRVWIYLDKERGPSDPLQWHSASVHYTPVFSDCVSVWLQMWTDTHYCFTPCFFLFIRPNWAKWAQASKKQPRIFPRGLNSVADVTTSSQVLHCHRHHSYSGAVFDLSHPPVYSHQMFKNKIRQVESETESMKSATNYIWPTF